MLIFLIILFILQLITFYFIALLYMRMAKFDKLETKQQKLMSEMDDAIAAYLTELKDENDRLIRLLEKRLDDEVEPAKKDSQKEKLHMAPAPSEKGQNQKPVIPVQVALQSYKSFSKPSVADNQEEEDDRSRALKLQKNGWSVEEIARELGKGKTEIELILKFK